MAHKIKISKLDAAKRQIETAIKLYFNNDDPVSIHTLAWASHTILSDLNKNGLPMILDGSLIKKEQKKKINKILSEARNHFKHADRDPDAVIDFVVENNEFVLLECCIKYEEITSEKVPYFYIYQSWFLSKYINTFNGPEEYKKQLLEIKSVYGNNKAKYFSEMLAASGRFST